MLLEVSAIILGVTHFLAPVTYYAYLKMNVGKPWGIESNNSFAPTLAVILPTYNEADLIRGRLEDLSQQDYPSNLVEVVIVDCSDDSTADIVKEWSTENSGLRIKLIREEKRRGKLHALSLGLRNVSSNCDLIVLTDADACWERQALRKAARYFADTNVGAVTSAIAYTGEKDELLEQTYRVFHRIVRVGESKIHSTPISNGPFLVIRADLLRHFGLPMFLGSDDSAIGSFIAFTGHRTIEVDDVMVTEPIRGNQFRRKTRRAQTLIANFLETKRYARNAGGYIKSQFDRTWTIEWWLHLVNPWLLGISVALLAIALVSTGSTAALVVLVAGSTLLISKVFRMWCLQQFYLATAALKNLRTKAVMWNR
jgi:glycosyltransferase involved in cell wall biosynthesis